jgi:tetratricopeptide (TPR) repeat protein
MVERTEDGKFHPYVMDFGLARETAGSDQSRSGLIEGTPRYMSPEQARGDTRNVDRRTDVYALGVTLYEMLVGRSPYEGTGEMDILLAVITAEPRPLRAVSANIPEDLEAVTLKCLEKEPAARYDSAKALAEDLGRYLDGEPVHARRIGLTQRLYRKARKHKPLVALGAALLLSLTALVGYGVRTRLATLAVERQARQQAELAQRLGQEITKMEWLLRSARQMPLHDLGREKGIIRKRMQKLQAEIASYGERSRGLGHYALGRGHLALHEYPEALRELREAVKEGNSSADVQYAMGLVMGKHFEKEMYEARLSGGGDWARKKRKEIEEKYLKGAVEALKKSREMRSDAPGYLEALIGYYQRDYEGALKRAEGAKEEAPWMYEVGKLKGDIHLEKALLARDVGKYEEAEKEFGEAVRSYEGAAEIGQSDAEVYEGLAEAWVRQIEMAATRGKPTQEAYGAAVAASDKVTVAEPQSVAGKLKKAFAAMLTMALTSAGVSSAERVKQCLEQAEAVLQREPENPYARDVAADCNAFAADGASGRGEDPEPLLRKAIGLLEPAVQRYPNFLWGLNDLANFYVTLGMHFQLHGHPSAREFLEKSLHYRDIASSLDREYLLALQNSLFTWGILLSSAKTEQELQSISQRAESAFSKCMSINSQFQQCYVNHLLVHARDAQRTYQAGGDPQVQIKRALETAAQARKLGGSFLDVEQNTALVHLVAASQQVRKKQDPGASLEELRAALGRCFAMAEKDAMCRTMAAQGEWVEGEWREVQGQSPVEELKRARRKAEEATRSPETYPDAWQVLAETQLRMAKAKGVKEGERVKALEAGLSAVEKIFGINPNHGMGRGTQGRLVLMRAKREKEEEARRKGGKEAAEWMEKAVEADPLLRKGLEAELREARALAAAPSP